MGNVHGLQSIGLRIFTEFLQHDDPLIFISFFLNIFVKQLIFAFALALGLAFDSLLLSLLLFDIVTRCYGARPDLILIIFILYARTADVSK